jgi:hypothetical protein
LQALAKDICGEDGLTGQVAARVGQALRVAESHRIADDRYDDRDGAGHLLHGAYRRLTVGQIIRFERDKLGCKRREPPVVALRRAHLQRDLPFDIAELVEPAPECIDIARECPGLRKATSGIACCCARTADGRPPIAPASKITKSRRLMPSPSIWSRAGIKL